MNPIPGDPIGFEFSLVDSYRSLDSVSVVVCASHQTVSFCPAAISMMFPFLTESCSHFAGLISPSRSL